MPAFDTVLNGFAVALEPSNLLFCIVGVVLGTIVGVLPGLGSAATIALLLPLTFTMSTTSAVIMLGGIWYGSMYGGSTTSILLRVPGESASVMTALDGFEMARQGRAGAALGISAIGSFVAGMLALIPLIWLAPHLAELALNFGPPEYVAIAVLGLSLVSCLSSGSVSKALCMAALGLVLGTVGLDPVSGQERFTYGTMSLQSGLDMVPVVIGLFGMAEVLAGVGRRDQIENVVAAPKGLANMLPNRTELMQSSGSIARGTVIGFIVGLLPGAGATISSYVAYALEKRVSKHPERFGKGAIQGVAAPEAANNAATASGFVPLLSLGIPANVVMALMLGAFMLHGITPGPTLVREHPDLFWGIICSMVIGNIVLLIINLPLIGLLVRLTLIPSTIMTPLILMVCFVGAYGVNNSTVDVGIMVLFGFIGYLMNRYEYPPAPLILAFVLGPMLETAFRQSMIMSKGSLGVFVSRPVSGLLLAILAATVAINLALMGSRKWRLAR